MLDKIPVQEFLEHSKTNLLIDVRSPAEYLHAHIPGAINIPLFTDEERKEVGTIYKQKSREDAIKTGLDFFGPNMKTIIEKVEFLVQGHESGDNNLKKIAQADLQNYNSILLYCWRGGMRSAAVAWLLSIYGFKVKILSGGYKAYRNYVFTIFEHPYRFKILGGFTGSGKTEVLSELKRSGERVIDLEAIACHKGSAFGNLNMPVQPTQEMFENLLMYELNHCNNSSNDTAIWLEDESQRIGLVNIPASVWNNMRQSPVYFIDVPFEERLQHITQEYSMYNLKNLTDAVERISKRLGGLETKKAIQYLHEKDFTSAFSVLLKYYDKHYLKALHNRENLSSSLIKFSCNKVDACNAAQLTQSVFA